MNTAIQELMHILDVNEKNFISIIDDKITIAYHNVIKKQVEHLLEKEKEQIIDAYEDGKENQRDSITNIYNYRIGEFYYNQTYNQNKS
jgi:N-dimethylarginine dimethylaminohydrolase